MAWTKRKPAAQAETEIMPRVIDSTAVMSPAESPSAMDQLELITGGYDRDDIFATPALRGPYDYPLATPLAGSMRRTHRSVRERTWARATRRFARTAAWALPLAAVLLAVSAAWGWPEPGGASSARWLLVTLGGLLFAVLGVIAMAALMAVTAGRRWAVLALVATLAGTVSVAPVLGLAGLARPILAGGGIPADQASALDIRLFDTATARWLGIGGLILLGVGFVALGCAILASEVLNRSDGWLVLIATAVAVFASYRSWSFLLAIAMMVLLAAALGLAFTASRLITVVDGVDAVDP